MYTIHMSQTPGKSCTGTLKGVSYEQIVKVLGFAPNINDDPSKVKYSWGFTVDTGDDEMVHCGIWDWKGSHKRNEWSTWGPQEVLDRLFPAG